MKISRKMKIEINLKFRKIKMQEKRLTCLKWLKFTTVCKIKPSLKKCKP